MNDTTVGTCARCGGRMLQPSAVWMVGPYPSPKCERCGFEYHGPVMGNNQVQSPAPSAGEQGGMG